MRGYFCIVFIDFMFKNESLVEFTNLFSSYDLKENYEIVLSYFI